MKMDGSKCEVLVVLKQRIRSLVCKYSVEVRLTVQLVLTILHLDRSSLGGRIYAHNNSPAVIYRSYRRI